MRVIIRLSPWGTSVKHFAVLLRYMSFNSLGMCMNLCKSAQVRDNLICSNHTDRLLTIPVLIQIRNSTAEKVSFLGDNTAFVVYALWQATYFVSSLQI